MEGIVKDWMKEVQKEVKGNDGGREQHLWENPVDVLGGDVELKEEEKGWLKELQDVDRPRVMKKICRRVQREIEEVLKERGCKEVLKFAPKLKNKGLLDIESQRIEVPETL